MAKQVSNGTGALLERLIDYAGTFPPAALPCGAAVGNYAKYRTQRTRLDAALACRRAPPIAERVPAELDGTRSRAQPTPTSRERPRSSRSASSRPGGPVYCEVPVGDLDEVKRAGCFAKLRTGGVKPEAIPSVERRRGVHPGRVRDRRLAFKATAGLHHPVRAEHPLTYEADAPRAVMHGFLNVFLAAAFAWHGDATSNRSSPRPTRPRSASTTAHTGATGRWTPDQSATPRTNFAHSFGSCSFEEPVRDLEALGLL